MTPINPKKLLIGIAGGALFLLILFSISLPKDSKLFKSGEEIQELGRMIPTDSGQALNLLVEDQNKDFLMVRFEVDQKIIDSLNFTRTDITSACQAGAERAREYVEGFVYQESPQLKFIKGKAMLVIPVLVDSTHTNKMFIVGEVTKEGDSLPMRLTREETVTQLIKQ